MDGVIVEQVVAKTVVDMEGRQQQAVAVLLGHEDWLDFSTQSKVSYTPFGSARRYQPALSHLQMVRVDEMHCLRVVTQQELDEYIATHQVL